MDLVERFRANLLGLPVGDALGTTLELKQLDTFTPIEDMVGGGPFNLNHSQRANDTSIESCTIITTTPQCPHSAIPHVPPRAGRSPE